MVFWSNIILFLVGVFVGSYASIAGGGALILVPFFTFLNLPLASGIATMRLGAVIQEGISTLAFWRKRALRIKSAMFVGIWTMLGSFLGSKLTLALDNKILSLIIGMLMLFLLFLIPKISSIKAAKKQLVKIFDMKVVVYAFLLGIYGGFYGAGFGTFMVLFFSFFFGTSLFVSAGNARLVGFMMSASASFGFWKSSIIRWDIFVPVTFGLVIGSWLGVGWAEKYGTRWIKLLLQAVVFASAIKLIFFP